MRLMLRLTYMAPLLLAGCVIYDRPATVIPARVPLTAGELIAMRRGGTSDETIRKELSFHGVARKLTADELVELKEAGADEELLKAAVAAEVREPREAQVVYYRDRYDSYYRYHYHDPGIYFGLGAAIGYTLGWRHHGWPRRARTCW